MIEHLALITREHGPAAAAREVRACVADATRAVEHQNAYVALDFLDHALLSVLALDRDGAWDWSGVELLVEDLGALREAAKRSPDMPARGIYAYGSIRDGLDVLWATVQRVVDDRDRLGRIEGFEDDGDVGGE